jgi:chemotaxis protein methyltransferase CheR
MTAPRRSPTLEAEPPTWRPMSEMERLLLNLVLEAHLGLTFPEHKREILEARLAPRLLANGLRSFTEYARLLESGDPAELGYLRRAVTNHETYFFRETHQFDALFSHGLQQLEPGFGERRTVRLLSAGCATGEEAYTLGFWAKENQFRTMGRAVTIDAFDLCDASIAAAERGEFGHAALRGMSEEQIARYLTEVGPDRYRVKPAWRAAIQFRVGNAMQLGTFYRGEPYDVVYCRNVLIYFAEAAIRHVIDNFAACIRPGGLLFLGHSESIIGLSRAFDVVRVGSTIAYERVAT